MSTASRKKQHERFLLERSIEASGLSAQIVSEREEPDFLVRLEERLIGVEVTQLFKTHASNGPLPFPQAQESISDKVVSRARQLYEASGAPPAHVSVCFALGCDLRQIDRDGTAQQPASSVGAQNHAAWQRADWRPGCPGDLPYKIAFVHALGVPSKEMGRWYVARAGWVASLPAEALQSCIDEKASRLPKYQDSIAENWLLIVANVFLRPSGQSNSGTGPAPRTRMSGITRMLGEALCQPLVADRHASVRVRHQRAISLCAYGALADVVPGH